jgi:nucleoside-diphosphate-sugar epimerase
VTPARRVLVTGGAGFIGSHMVDELLRRRIETIVIDNFTSGSRENLKHHEGNDLLTVLNGDLSQVDELLQGFPGIDVVFHEAAIASVPRSVDDPVFVNDVNVTGSVKLLDYCARNHVEKMVFASSAAVYGAIAVRASEELLCAPASPYGASKLAVECYLSAFHNAYGLETVGLRYFNVYGPRQKVSQYSGVITSFLNALLHDASPTVFGDGTQTRDFVNVRDVVQANMLAMEQGSIGGQVFNVASGTNTTLLQLLAVLQSITGTEELEPLFEKPRVGDVKSGAASIARIRSRLGYSPSCGLKEGLLELVRSAEGTGQDVTPEQVVR